MTPEQILGYPVDERTRFSVRIEIYPKNHDGRPRVRWLRTIKTLTDCQRHYIAARDESDLGASCFGPGHVFDEAGQHVARISYNGRLWGPEEWTPGQQVVAEAPSREAA